MYQNNGNYISFVNPLLTKLKTGTTVTDEIYGLWTV